MTIATSIKEKIITATISFDDSSRITGTAVGWRCGSVVLASTEKSVFIDGFVVFVVGAVDAVDVDVVVVDVVDSVVVKDNFVVVGSKR